MGAIKTLRLLVCVLSVMLLVQNKANSWNALGHKLIVQIAYDHLSTQAKKTCNHYNQALSGKDRRKSLVSAASWLDSLSAKNNNEANLNLLHYIDSPFSFDGSPLIPPKAVNAISAILTSQDIMQSPRASRYDKGLNLRILLHVVGDLHQPLHAVSQFSKNYPHGDKGGNLFFLGKNALATNLHSYWDKGGGLLSTKSKLTDHKLKQMAKKIERQWPCQFRSIEMDPRVWGEESYQLAKQKAYSILPRKKPSKTYQQMVKQISQQRIALAGCRLAYLLNHLNFS